jgi:hypothetical protein
MKSTTKTVPSEYMECLLLVQYLDELKRTGKIKAYTHIPNETYTPSWHAKTKNKNMGVMPGFPDYVVVTNDQVLFIEMKKSKGGVVSDNQKLWLATLDSVGMMVAVCHGFSEAEDFINLNLSFHLPPLKQWAPGEYATVAECVRLIKLNKELMRTTAVEAPEPTEPTPESLGEKYAA